MNLVAATHTVSNSHCQVLPRPHGFSGKDGAGELEGACMLGG